MRETAAEFLLRAARADGRIVSTNDLIDMQIASARAENRMWVDPDTHLGYVILPWSISTLKDKARERKLMGPPDTAGPDT